MLWLGHREYAMVGVLRTCNGWDIENNQQVIALNSRLQSSFLAWLDSRTNTLSLVCVQLSLVRNPEDVFL